jgi:HEAT repeat protein
VIPRRFARRRLSVVRWLLLIVAASGCPRPNDWRQALDDLRHADPQVRRIAAQRLFETRPHEPPVIPALTAALRDVDPEVRRWSCRALGELPAQPALQQLEDVLQDGDVSVRRAAAFAAQRLSPESTAYRAELISAMKAGDGGVIVAVQALQPPAEWAIPTLATILKDDRRPGLRRLAAEALGILGSQSAAASTALEQATKDRNDQVRAAAAAARARLQK